jgi:hypothetical protein
VRSTLPGEEVYRRGLRLTRRGNDDPARGAHKAPQDRQADEAESEADHWSEDGQCRCSEGALKGCHSAARCIRRATQQIVVLGSVDAPLPVARPSSRRVGFSVSWTAFSPEWELGRRHHKRVLRALRNSAS